MSRILGIDVGTNSLGLTVRDDSISNKPEEQIVFSSVNLFPSGVGNGKSGEFSYAAERTKYRSQRKIYRVRRYRKWATLRLLIEDEENAYCPLTKTELERWMKYDKEEGLQREYPIDSVAFQQWIRLDFNGDGIPDYTSPYELRNELATAQLDFTIAENRFKLGRAMYHIAQRRGFRSSKGDTIQAKEAEETNSTELKMSEIQRSGALEEYRINNSLPTIGSALYSINKDGERVRKEYQAIRKQYKDEIAHIFEFQNGLDVQSDLYRRLISEKKGEGTIFYKKPLKSQKGQVGKCTLEPSKPRCPQSRPEYEEFIAWSLLNNIRFGEGCKNQLTTDQKCEIYNELFIRATDFKFDRIRAWIENKTGASYCYSSQPDQRTINYKDNTSIPASNVTYRFKELLGVDWNTWTYQPENAVHTNTKDLTSTHQTTYTWVDVWHICFSADDEEPVKLFAEKSNLNYDLLVRLWKDMPVAYANLSLKAINNINRFLKKGLLYNEACLLAKLPDIFKDAWTEDVEKVLFKSLSTLIAENAKERKIVNVANALIANYKSLPDEEKQGFHDFSYTLTEYDYQDIKHFVDEAFGVSTFANMKEEEKSDILRRVADYYQSFFHDESRKYIESRRIDDDIKQFLLDNFDNIDSKSLKKLYHHSQIEYYKPSVARKVERGDNVVNIKLLESPAIAALRNPMALRVLYTLRRKVNDLLQEGIIDENDTRIVVEVARELNDSNMRWAIKKYQDIKKAENDEYRKYIQEILDESDLNKVRMLVEQHDCNGNQTAKKKERREMNYERYMADLVKRYRLWIEQGGFSIYTGEPITITKLLNREDYDIEHTIPRSISFDDSLSNKTLCESYFNRNVKGKQLPSQLSNYEAILRRIQPWIERVEELRSNIEYWKNKSKKAQTKEAKDKAIRQIHLWRMEYDYWSKKVEAFKITEVKAGFRNSQLVDTSIIAKYSMHFLKSVFNRVDVQKGEVTAKFRKILGIQDDGTLKVRDNNSHHAIDAMVLTYVPVAAAREKILKLYYELQEAKELQHDTHDIEIAIKAELRKFDLNVNFAEVINRIKNTVLASRESSSKALSIAKRRKRVRGRIVPLRDVEGKILFEKNEDGTYKKDIYGHRIPVAKEWIKGDSIRGSLHGDTFYGAITQHNDKTVRYVVRRELKYKANASDSGFKDWNELEKVIVNKALVKKMQEQFEKGTSFKDACAQGIYTKVLENGDKIGRIRHIRCYSNIKNPQRIKCQLYPSKFEYKNYYYAQNGENIAYALYKSGEKRIYKCLSLIDTAKIAKTEDIVDVRNAFEESITKVEGSKKKPLNVEYIKCFAIIPGQMVILKGEDNSLNDLTDAEKSIRLYRITRIFDPKQGLLQLQHHLEARDNDALKEAYPEKLYGKKGQNGFSEINYLTPYPRLLLSPGKQNFWIEGTDFRIVNGRIISIK